MKITEDLVLSRQAATYRTPLAPDKDVFLTGVDLVLVDPSTLTHRDPKTSELNTWFRCTFPGCDEAYAGARSALSHLTRHSPKRRAAKAEAEAEKLRAAKTASFERRSAGVSAGVAARQARRDALRKRSPQEILEEMANELTGFATKLRDVAAIFEVPEPKAPAVSEEQVNEWREKAAQYDIIKSALK
jgi:hypothetical protein